nr:heavy metal-associated domain-containing protein [Tahibacter harae]
MSCAGRVERALRVPGVTDAAVNLAGEQATVRAGGVSRSRRSNTCSACGRPAPLQCPGQAPGPGACAGAGREARAAAGPPQPGGSGAQLPWRCAAGLSHSG